MPTDKIRIRELVLDIMVDQLGVPRDSLFLHTTFKYLGADSLDAVELVMELEEEFDICISDEDAEKIQTVEEAIKYIENALRNRHVPAGAMWYSIVPFSSAINDERHEYATQNGFRGGEKIYFKSYPASIVNHYWDQVNNRWVKYSYGSWPYNFYEHLQDVTTGKKVIIGICGTLISDVWAEKARKAGVEPHWQHEAFNNLPKIVETTRPIIAKGGTRIGTACEVTSVKTPNFRVTEHVHFYWMEEKSLFCGRIDSLDSQHYNDVHIKRCGDGQICKVGSKNCISNDSCEVIINDELHNPAAWYRNKERKKGQVYIEWLKKHIDPVYLLKMAAELENHAKSELQKVVATLGKKPLSKEQYGRRSDSTK